MSKLDAILSSKLPKIKNLLSISDLSVSDVESVLDLAQAFIETPEIDIKQKALLRGRTVINLFFEDSTRTRVSFEIAGKRLGADVINVSQSGSSASKKETLYDTARNIDAMGPSLIVVRHRAAGAPHALNRLVEANVINAGDGSHEHPTQALLDYLTLRQHLKSVAAKRIVIVGDIGNSRVARSNILLLKMLGAQVVLAGPASMIPPEMSSYAVEISYDLKQAIQQADAIMMLRIQAERIASTPFPTLREYSRVFGLNSSVLKLAKPEAVVLHPGPVNRGVEISPEVADGKHSLILNQVSNGVALRMALLYLLGKIHDC